MAALPRLSRLASAPGHLTVLSWNLLADCYTRERYEFAGEHVLWANRLPRQLQILQSHPVDVVCLQEVMFDAYAAEYEPFMRGLGYVGVIQDHKKRSAEQLVGNATFFRSTYALKWTDHRSRVLAIGLEVDGRALAIANVHLEGHPDLHDMRFNQVKSLIKQLQKQKPSAAIITGDFNNEVRYSLRDVLIGGSIEAGAMDEGFVVTKEPFSHDLGLDSAYGDDEAYSFIMPPRARYRLDHCFHSKAALTPVAVLDVLPAAECAEILASGLPNRIYPSDHLPVGVQYTWR